MLVSKIKEEDLSLEIVDRLLFQDIEDTGEIADCIIVLGSVKAAKYRVPVAVDAYRAGRAKKIMLCGGVLRDFLMENAVKPSRCTKLLSNQVYLRKMLF